MVGDDQIGFAAPGDDGVELARHLRPEIEVSAIAARHSLVTSSITLGLASTRIGARMPVARCGSCACGRSGPPRGKAAASSLDSKRGLGAQKNVQPAITKPVLLGRQRPQAAAQGVLSRSTRSIADGLAIGLDQAARPALAHLVGGYGRATASRLAAGVRIFCHEVFQHGIVEHRVGQKPLQRFSLAFSSSSCLSRLASDTSIPPNLAFQP
jgi:hypothetical protein